VAKVGDRLPLGQAAGLAVELGPVVATVEMDGQLPGRGRQLVVEGDPGPPAGLAADGRAGEAAAVGPELRLAAGEDLGLGLADRDLDVVVVEDGRDRQRRAEGNGAGLGLLRPYLRQSDPAPCGTDEGEGTAAQGAEEGSAPEAGRC
jgi:hypothetical protein